MTLEIRLLGPIEVRRDEKVLRLGGASQRRLLAFLALRPGRTRTVDSICSSLWPDGDLPVDPHQTVRTYVSRLRSALGDATALTTRDGGYRLSVDESLIDARRFELLVKSANDPNCELDRTVVLLDEALSLWAGPALDGFESEEWARAEAVRLEELRAQAIDNRAEAQLGLGWHDDAVAALWAGAAASPLRERTHRLLMVALERAGRQAEALRVYQEYRRRLSTDLGLEPGEEIRELEAAIATGTLPHVLVDRRLLHGYRLIERVGEGAFAVVYSAVQPSVGREVAMKVIRPALADDPDFVRRFEAEAQLIARLEHPHVVPLYDYWREPGAAYLVMRLFRGGTLEQRLATMPCTTQEAARLMTQIGSALASAHRAGVVHRDVKPANIFLDRDGNFFLGDFGIASVMSALPRVATSPADSPSLGSIRYASPEQLRRGSAGPPSDIHGLGIVLFEALTGGHPFSFARTRDELEFHQLHDPLPSVSTLTPPASARVDEVIAKATAKQPSDRYPSIEVFVADAVAALSGVQPEAARTEASWRNPYKGLRAFQEADAADFFGRDSLIERMLEAMADGDRGGRFLTLVGPSGSGKSSAVRAGLVPRLRAGALPGSQRWFFTSMIPGANPFEELEVALGRVATRPIDGLVELMTSDPHGMAQALRHTAPGEDDEVVLLVDQFEELFTLCPDDVRGVFIRGLVEAVTEPQARVRVVATLRADFYDRPLRNPELAPLVERGMVSVTPLAPDELEAAIIEPTRGSGASFEAGLAALVAGEVRDQPGALPLLEYALTELFDRHRDGILTVADYREIGGLSGAVTRRAESLYDEADGEQQVATQRLFTRLVSLGEGTEDTRRRVQAAELGSAPATTAVLERYAKARLLSFDHDPRTREPTVELAHEALIQGWPRLRRWLDDDREGLRIHRDLTARAAAWEASGRDQGELYRGARLEMVERWAADRPGDLNAVEAGFLSASSAQHRREVETRQRSARRTRRALVLVAVVAVVALVAGAVAWQQQRRARESASEARRQQTAAQSAEFAAETGRLAALAPTLASTNPSAALVLAAEAEQRVSGPETWGALEQVLVAADDNLGYLHSDVPVRAVQFDGPTSIVGVGTTAVTVWDAESRRRLATVDLPVPVRTPQFGGDPYVPAAVGGGQIAWVGPDAVARVMRLDEPGEARVVIEDADNVTVDPTGTRLVVTTRTGDVSMVQLPDLHVVWTAKGDGTRTVGESASASGVAPPPEPYASLPSLGSLRLAPDGKTVVVARWSVRAFDMASGTEVGSGVPAVPPGFAVFDPTDPQRLVTLSLHSLTTMTYPELRESGIVDLGARFGFEVTLAALPDGRMAVGTADGEVAIVTLGSGPSAEVVAGNIGQLARGTTTATSSTELIEPHIGKNVSFALSPSGPVLAVGGDAGVALISLDGGGLIRRAVPRTDDHGYYVGGHDGSWVVTASPPSAAPPEQQHLVRSAARLWDCPSSSPCTESTALGLEPTMEVTGDDRSDLVVVYTNLFENIGSSRLFDGATHVPRSTEILPGARFGGWLAIDPLRRWILIALNSTMRVADLRTGRPLAILDLEWPNPSATVLPAGAGVLVMNIDTGDSFVLDPTWTRQPSPLPAGQAAWAAFSPDGRFLATAPPIGDITLRDGGTFAPIRSFSSADPLSPFLPMAFSDDGRFLVTVHPAGGRLWDVASGQLVGQLIPTLRTTAPSSVWGRHVGLLTASQQFVHLWTFDVDAWPSTACRAAGRNLTHAEWEQFGPRDRPYHATCPQWPAAA